MQVIIPSDKSKLQKQIEALKYLIEHDTSDKDKRIHEKALRELEAASLKGGD